jgi:hypothetical protein
MPFSPVAPEFRIGKSESLEIITNSMKLGQRPEKRVNIRGIPDKHREKWH